MSTPPLRPIRPISSPRPTSPRPISPRRLSPRPSRIPIPSTPPPPVRRIDPSSSSSSSAERRISTPPRSREAHRRTPSGGVEVSPSAPNPRTTGKISPPSSSSSSLLQSRSSFRILPKNYSSYSSGGSAISPKQNECPPPNFLTRGSPPPLPLPLINLPQDNSDPNIRNNREFFDTSPPRSPPSSVGSPKSNFCGPVVSPRSVVVRKSPKISLKGGSRSKTVSRMTNFTRDPLPLESSEPKKKRGSTNFNSPNSLQESLHSRQWIPPTVLLPSSPRYEEIITALQERNLTTIACWKNEVSALRTSKGENVLHLAVQEQMDKEFVKGLINTYQLKHFIQDPDDNGCTPLHFAAISSLPSIFESLLSFDPDLFTEDSRNRIPLHYFCTRDFAREVQDWRTKKVDIESEIHSIKRVLSIMAEHTEMRGSLIDSPLFTLTQNQESPLYLSMMSGCLWVGWLLIKMGSELHEEDLDKISPLHWFSHRNWKNENEFWELYGSDLFCSRIDKFERDGSDPSEGSEEEETEEDTKVGEEETKDEKEEKRKKEKNEEEMREVAKKRVFLLKRRVFEKFMKNRPTLSGSLFHNLNETPLHWACRNDDSDIVKWLCNIGADVAALDAQRHTPLDILKACHPNSDALEPLYERSRILIFDAVIQAQYPVIKRLGKEVGLNHHHPDKVSLTAPFFQDPVSVRGTPLHFAAFMGNSSMVKFLMHYGADPSIQNKFFPDSSDHPIERGGQTPVHLAAAVGNLNCVRDFLKENSADPYEEDMEGFSIFQYLSRLRFKVKEGVVSKMKDKDILEPKIFECQIVKIADTAKGSRIKGKAGEENALEKLRVGLLQGITNPNAPALQSTASMDLEIEGDRFSQAKLLFDAAQAPTQNWSSKYERIVKAFLSRTKSTNLINARDESGLTPLMVACQNQNFAMIDLLLDAKAVASWIGSGFSCFHFILAPPSASTTPIALDLPPEMTPSYQELEMVKEITSNLSEVVGVTGEVLPRSMGQEWNDQHEKCVKRLLDAGARVMNRDLLTQTALHLAAKNGFLRSVRLFLERGNSDIQDMSGKTALFHAIENEHFEIVDFLIHMGANPDIPNKKGVLPIDLIGNMNHLARRRLETRIKGSNLSPEVLEVLQTGDLQKVQQHFAPDSEKETKREEAGEPPKFSERGKRVEKGMVFSAAMRGFWDIALWAFKSISALHRHSSLVAHSTDGDNVFHCIARSYQNTPACNDFLGLALRYAGEALLNQKKSRGETPLHIAVLCQQEKLVSEYLEKGAFVNIINTKGETELHYCAMTGSIAILRMLLQHGADPDMICDAHYTPSDVADWAGNLKYVEMFQRIRRTKEQIQLNWSNDIVLRVTIDRVDLVASATRSPRLTKYSPKSPNYSPPLSPSLLPISSVASSSSSYTSSSSSCSISPPTNSSSPSSPPLSSLPPASPRPPSPQQHRSLFCSLTHQVNQSKQKCVSTTFSNTTASPSWCLQPEPFIYRIKGVYYRRLEMSLLYRKIDSLTGDKILTPAVSLSDGYSTGSPVMEHPVVKEKSEKKSKLKKKKTKVKGTSSVTIGGPTGFRKKDVQIENLSRPAMVPTVWRVDDGVIGTATFDLQQPEGDTPSPFSTNLFDENQEIIGKVHGTICLSQSDDEIDFILSKYTTNNPYQEVKNLKKATNEKKLGAAKFMAGFRPKYPVIIIPGLASSALEAWSIGKERRTRIWVDPLKIGNPASVEKISQRLFHQKEIRERIRRVTEQGTTAGAEVARREWLYNMSVSEDGWSDPPGVRVRPVQGLHAVDYLSDTSLAKKPSYVFAYVINALIDVGYDLNNLNAAPYDWRLPPEKLQERDNYFETLRALIELQRKFANEKVVLLGHSMGCRCAQYFFEWAKHSYGQTWLDENVHALLALGPPFLGAPKALRTVLSGDCMGLEMFLDPFEGRAFARMCGSTPWLLPIQEKNFPDVVCRFGTKGEKEVWKEVNTETAIAVYAPRVMSFQEKYYDQNPFWGKAKSTDSLIPILSPPPIRNLWVVYGTNLPTEVSYYYRLNEREKEISLDGSADKFSEKKKGSVNPRGLTISGGIAYETRNTFQPTAKLNASGDGTIPYCSLNYLPNFWKSYVTEHHLSLEVKIVEIEGAEHREMLNNEAVLNTILDFVCVRSGI